MYVGINDAKLVRLFVTFVLSALPRYSPCHAYTKRAQARCTMSSTTRRAHSRQYAAWRYWSVVRTVVLCIALTVACGAMAVVSARRDAGYDARPADTGHLGVVIAVVTAATAINATASADNDRGLGGGGDIASKSPAATPLPPASRLRAFASRLTRPRTEKSMMDNLRLFHKRRYAEQHNTEDPHAPIYKSTSQQESAKQRLLC